MTAEDLSQHLMKVAERARGTVVDQKEIQVLESIITKLKQNPAIVLNPDEYTFLQKLESRIKISSPNKEKSNDESLNSVLLQHGKTIHELWRKNRLPTISFWLKAKYLTFPNPYYILKLPTTATKEEIKKRYRLLSRLFHPDLSKQKDISNEEVFKLINEANELLTTIKTKDLVKDLLRGATSPIKPTNAENITPEAPIAAVRNFSDFLQHFDTRIAPYLNLSNEHLIQVRQQLKRDFLGSKSKEDLLASLRKSRMSEDWIRLMIPLIDAVQWQSNQQSGSSAPNRPHSPRPPEQPRQAPRSRPESSRGEDALVIGPNTETMVKRNENNLSVDLKVSLMRLFGTDIKELFKNNQAAGLIHPGNKYGGGAVCEDAAALFKDKHGVVHLTVADTAGGMASKAESTVTNLGSDFAVSVVETIQHYVTNYPQMHLPQVLAEVNRSLSNLHAVDNRYFEAKRKREKIMATAAHVSIYPDGQFRAIAVADARVYRMFNGELIQVTDDQTPVAELVRKGAITPQMADNHQFRNVIGESIGDQLNENLYMREKRGLLRKGEMLLVVTDGATQDQFTSSWLRNVINRASNPKMVISNLNSGMNAIMQAGQIQDNIAVLCYQYK